MTEMISIATARAKPEHVAELETELRARIDVTRSQPGCLAFTLHRLADDPTSVVAYEHWASREDWERHMQGDHITSLMGVFERVLASPPDIRVIVPLDDQGTVSVARSIAKRLATEVFSEGNLDTFNEIFADEYVNHNIPVPGIPGTKEGFRQLVVATRQAFPDITVHIDNLVADSDIVVFNDHVTATSTGEFLGVPPNGQPLRWTEIHMLRVHDGRIVEHWTNFDQLGILVQLGAIPGPA
jgi:steroid delta-isomerase-like uncharacterized protein